jgi:hypothetical protein
VRIVANKTIASALLILAMTGIAHAEKATDRPLATDRNAGMPHHAATSPELRSVNVEEDVKRTEQRLQTELNRTLGKINESIAAN